MFPARCSKEETRLLYCDPLRFRCEIHHSIHAFRKRITNGFLVQQHQHKQVDTDDCQL
jgi:hypothetical protein